MTTIYNIAADQLALDDDIFARPPRALARQQAHTARITCRVCAMPDQVPLDAPGPLCRACGEDVAATRAKVKSWLAGTIREIDLMLEVWEHKKANYPAHWAKLNDARLKAGEDDAALAEAFQRARAADPIYARLLDIEAQTRQGLEPLEVERARLERALALLDDLTPQLAAGEYILPAGVDVEQCRSCGASIVWTKTAAGKAVPLSLACVEERGGQRVTKTHFVDCPDGRGWKR